MRADLAELVHAGITAEDGPVFDRYMTGQLGIVGKSRLVADLAIVRNMHVGHALAMTLEDIITRYKRMRGFKTLWLPGTDHAGIATQAVVEKRLLQDEKKTRHDLGREKFIERVWAWKEEYGNRIVGQLKRVGSSCDWERQRFTMDEGFSKAVIKAFVDLHNQGLSHYPHFDL